MHFFRIYIYLSIRDNEDNNLIVLIDYEVLPYRHPVTNHL